MRICKISHNFLYDPSVLKDIMQERLNPPPKPVHPVPAPAQSQVSIPGMIFVCILVLFFLVAFFMSAFDKNNRRRSHDDWDSKGRWVDVVAEKEYYRR